MPRSRSNSLYSILKGPTTDFKELNYEKISKVISHTATQTPSKNHPSPSPVSGAVARGGEAPHADRAGRTPPRRASAENGETERATNILHTISTSTVLHSLKRYICSFRTDNDMYIYIYTNTRSFKIRSFDRVHTDVSTWMGLPPFGHREPASSVRSLPFRPVSSIQSNLQFTQIYEVLRVTTVIVYGMQAGEKILQVHTGSTLCGESTKMY